jgi:hypothetical protein
MVTERRTGRGNTDRPNAVLPRPTTRSALKTVEMRVRDQRLPVRALGCSAAAEAAAEAENAWRAVGTGGGGRGRRDAASPEPANAPVLRRAKRAVADEVDLGKASIVGDRQTRKPSGQGAGPNAIHGEWPRGG